MTRSAKRSRSGALEEATQTRARKPADRLPHAFDALQLARERRENLARKIVGKLLGQRRPELGFDSPHDRIEAQPEETLARLLIGEAKARPRRACGA